MPLSESLRMDSLEHMEEFLYMSRGPEFGRAAAGLLELLSTLLLELHKAGVPLLLSTDSFGAAVPGYSAHQELELLVAAGLTPYEALRTGTVNVAAFLGEAETHAGTRTDF